MILSYENLMFRHQILIEGYAQAYKPSNNAIEMLDLVIVDYLSRTIELDPVIPTSNHT